MACGCKSRLVVVVAERINSPYSDKWPVNHAEDLTKVVQKAVLLCEVATLAREFQLTPFEGGTAKSDRSASMFGMSKEDFDGILRRSMKSSKELTVEGEAGKDSGYQGGLIIDPGDIGSRRGMLDQSQRMNISELLGAWFVINRVGQQSLRYPDNFII